MKAKLIIIGLALAYLQQSRAADDICNGVLVEQRGEAGYSLGDCDLNALSNKDFKRIKAVCGEPNGVDEDHNKAVCHVSAVVVRKKNFPGLKVVTKIYFITAEQP